MRPLCERLAGRLQDAVGRRFGRARSEDDAKGTVIGVVADFHYASLREPIEPAVFAYRQWFYDYLAVRVRDFLRLTFSRGDLGYFMAADKPFGLHFWTKNSMAIYRAERDLGRLLPLLPAGYFAGLFGVVRFGGFTAERRGVRLVFGKVLGVICFKSCFVVVQSVFESGACRQSYRLARCVLFDRYLFAKFCVSRIFQFMAFCVFGLAGTFNRTFDRWYASVQGCAYQSRGNIAA